MNYNYELTGKFREIKPSEPNKMWATAAMMVLAQSNSGGTVEQIVGKGEGGQARMDKLNKGLRISGALRMQIASEFGLIYEIGSPIDLTSIIPKLRGLGPQWIFNAQGDDAVFYGICGGKTDNPEGMRFKLIESYGPMMVPFHTFVSKWGNRHEKNTIRVNSIFANSPWKGGESYLDKSLEQPHKTSEKYPQHYRFNSIKG